MTWDGQERRKNNGETERLVQLRLKVVSLEEKLKSSENALQLARESMEHRLDGMNEFRETLRDQASKFVTKAEHDFVVKDIRELRESRAELAGKANMQSVIWAYIISATGILIGIVALLK